MNIFRIEKDGYGPLTIGLRDRAVNALAHEACATGAWGENMDVPMDYCYGCKTVEDLYLWFPKPVFDKLIELGFKLTEYTVTEFVEGETEVAFNKTTAVLV